MPQLENTVSEPSRTSLIKTRNLNSRKEAESFTSYVTFVAL